jgi:hypothetical protein
MPLRFALAPSTAAIDSPQPGDFANSGAGGEGLNPRNFAQNVEVHGLIV